MILEVKNSITGDFIAPKSKSFAIRAAIAAFLANKEVRLTDYPKNTDSLSAVNIILQLGGKAVFEGEDLIIRGDEIILPKVINCGESGLCLNIALVLALQSKTLVTLTGEKTLLTRNLAHIINFIKENKIKFYAEKSRAPFTIFPSPRNPYYKLECSQSSQLASGMLFAAIYNPDIRFKIKNLVSQSYFDLTVKILADFGYTTILHRGTYTLAKTAEPPSQYEIEGDYSGAANILAAAAISGDITYRGLKPDSIQADRVILDIIKRAGAKVNFSNNILHVKSSELIAFAQNIEDCPDLFPILCVLAAYAKGISTISGIGRLKHKETNRVNVMGEELRKAGVDIRYDNMTAVIHGGKPWGAHFSSHNDHRIAMALTILSLFASTPSTLSEPECVEKSYPDFFRALGII